MEVSIIVPVYNVEKYLSKCLDSIYGQAFKDFEVIIVNDGSTDGSLAIAQEYFEKYKDNTKLISQKNGGLSAARNTGLGVASGKYILFVDTDDTINVVMLEKMYSLAEENDSDLVMCAFRSVDEDGKELSKHYENALKCGEKYNLASKKELLLCQNAAWNKLYKRSVIQDNNLSFTEGVWYEDLRFTKKYMFYAQNVVYTDELLYNYLIRQGSIMNSMADGRNTQIIDAFVEVIDFYKAKNVFEKYSSEIEFTAIEHIFIATLVRMCRSGKIDMLKKIRTEFEKLFPNYKKNKYLNTLDRNRKLVYFLLLNKLYPAVKLIFSVKEGIK